MSKGLRWLFC